MLRNFLMKKMLQRQLKDVPEAEQERILNLIESNPDFFQKIAEEVKKKMDSGKDQMTATMEVMQQNGSELQRILGENK